MSETNAGFNLFGTSVNFKESGLDTMFLDVMV